MFGAKSVSKKQLLRAIDELQMHPSDRVRILGDIGITGVGLGLGIAAAGTVAAVAGATSIPVLTTAASAAGMTVVAATPIGWVIGAGVAGAGLAYGVSRMIRGGGISEGRKAELLQLYRDRLREIQQKETTETISVTDRNQFISSLRELIERDALKPRRAFDLIQAVEKGALPISDAYSMVSAILRDLK